MRFVDFLLNRYGREALEEVYQEEEEYAAQGYYDVYTEYTEDPESLEDAINGVIAYLEQGAE